MTLLLRAARLALGAAVLSTATPACFSAGNGTAPPPNTFYFPTGLTVSTGANVLYAINSDFDLQWNGGTLQSYDLFQIRQDTASLIQANLSGASTPPPQIPLLQPTSWQPNCMSVPPPPTNVSGIGVPLGQSCAPPVDATQYVRDSAIVGAFATDLQLSAYPYGAPSAAFGPLGTRLFAPVAGNATITWADVSPDDPNAAPPSNANVDGADPSTYPPFAVDCGTRVDGRCADDHQTGNDPNSFQNTRNATIAGDPFGMAQSQDASVLTVTSETDTRTSLLTTGFPGTISGDPTMQFVLDGLPVGGVGLVAVPHDPLAGVPLCELVGDVQSCVRPAFLQTNRNTAEVDLLRYYDDGGNCTAAPCPSSAAPTLFRPFLEKARAYTITANNTGTDSRGIAIDPTPRLQCKAAATTPAELTTCAQLPARVFIANRTPPSIIVGHIGQQSLSGDGTYDPDQLTIAGNVSLLPGPSKLFLAPIVARDADGIHGHYQMMLFVVCYDSNEVLVYDPNDLDSPFGATPLGLIPTGAGPYAMAFEPFVLEEAATGADVPIDPRQPADLAIRRYRFAYVASFTHSYVQVIDLDQTSPTFLSVVFTLGTPTVPKGQ